MPCPLETKQIRLERAKLAYRGMARQGLSELSEAGWLCAIALREQNDAVVRT